uniref:Uncharacterized protein n=1 Tax=Anas platyrhynchos TaxID=8839 RepID=A0A8B9T1A5_ANAPL
MRSALLCSARPPEQPFSAQLLFPLGHGQKGLSQRSALWEARTAARWRSTTRGAGAPSAMTPGTWRTPPSFAASWAAEGPWRQPALLGLGRAQGRSGWMTSTAPGLKLLSGTALPRPGGSTTAGTRRTQESSVQVCRRWLHAPTPPAAQVGSCPCTCPPHLAGLSQLSWCHGTSLPPQTGRRSALWEARTAARAEWRSGTAAPGGRCVTMPGTCGMPRWRAGSWAVAPRSMPWARLLLERGRAPCG